MKKSLYTFTLVLSMLVLTSVNFGQTLSNAEPHIFTKNEITNLKNGIKSENIGLKKSSIYFAGKYNLTEVEDELIDELKSQENSGVKLLIAKVLHKMYSKKGMLALEASANDSSDQRFRKFARIFINDYKNNSPQVVQN